MQEYNFLVSTGRSSIGGVLALGASGYKFKSCRSETCFDTRFGYVNGKIVLMGYVFKFPSFYSIETSSSLFVRV